MTPSANPTGHISSDLASSSSGTGVSREEAFAACERLTRTHYENFSVATRLLPRDRQRHFYSVYAFCRGVDDLGDEAAGDRMALLAEWERQLRLCYDGTPDHPYFIAIQETIEHFEIPETPFLKLIEANRRDQNIKRHPDYRELLDYCDHSANPVGRIVLYVLGYRDEERQALSDYTCTALQLANFWQDVARDYAMDRIYLPQDDMRRFGVTEETIASGRATVEFKSLMEFEVDRAMDLFRKGYDLVGMVDGAAKVDLALFTAGGVSILRAIQRQDYDVLAHRPELSRWGKVRLLGVTYLRTKLGLAPLSSRTFR